MKNYLLTAIFLMSLVCLTYSQTTWVTFETFTPNTDVFGGNTFSGDITNPNTTGNTSATVGLTTTGPEVWSGIAMRLGGTFNFSASDRTFTMDVLSADTGTVIFKVENSNGGEAEEVQATYLTTDVWETLSFEFPASMASGVYNRIVLFFRYNTTDSTAWYFDNIAGPAASLSGDVTVNFNVDDKLGVANTVSLSVGGTPVTMTEANNIWTGQRQLTAYSITSGGGEYEIILGVNGANIDTVSYIVYDDEDWNYTYLDVEPEDGTANAISVGTTPPIIDGVIDAVWYNAKAHTLQNNSWYGIPTGLYTYFKVMWDIDNVYILNYVDDNTPYNEGAVSEPWTNDNIEIFFDMNQSAGTPFDADDWQIRCVRGLDTWTGTPQANVDVLGAASDRAQTNLGGTDSTGYIVEWAIPWTALTATFLPLATAQFNFDALVADNANHGGEREFIISWNTEADVNYQNTEFYGTITLSSETNETGASALAEQTVGTFKIFPNPVNSKLTVSNPGGIYGNLTIYNMLGSPMIQVDVRSVNEFTIDLTDFSPGAYFVSYNDQSGDIQTIKLLKN